MPISNHFNTLKKIQDNTIFDDGLLADSENEFLYGDRTEEHEEALNQLINNLVVDNIFSFIASAYEDIELGKRVKGIHVLDTFEVLLSSEKSDESSLTNREKTYHIYDEKRCQTSFFNPCGWVYKYLKDQSINSYMYFLPIHHKKNDLVPHLKSFSKNTDLDYDTLHKFVADENWEGFVKIVLEKQLV